MILVTGATGTVGSHLVRELANSGVPTRALVRSVDAVSSLLDIGIEPTVGAFEDDDSLRRALAGVERVFLLSPAGTDAMVDQQLRVFEAVTRGSDVSHVVKLSSITADEATDASIVAAHRQIEEALERSGIAWTHLRPNWFMQNELANGRSIGTDGVFQAPDVSRVSMIDARDVAAVAAQVLTGDGHEGNAYTLTGPEPLSYADVAVVYSRVLDRPVRWQRVTLGEARAAMVASGLPVELAAGFCEVLRRYHQGGVTEHVSPAVAELIGREPRTFDQFVRDHADHYQPIRV